MKDFGDLLLILAAIGKSPNNPQSTIHNPKSEINQMNCVFKSAIPNPQSEMHPMQCLIKSAIRNLKSEMEK